MGQEVERGQAVIDAIQLARERKQMSVTLVARLGGVTQSHLSRVLHSKVPISAALAEGLAEALDAPGVAVAYWTESVMLRVQDKEWAEGKLLLWQKRQARLER
jgi:transcriptional regulator with XRE-family HTH domain